MQAAALLVLELAYADPVLTPRIARLIAEHLHERWGLQRARPHAARAAARGRAPHAFRRLRRAGCGSASAARERLELVERMWTRRVQPTVPSAPTRSG